MFPKIVGFPPQIIHFNRVFHYFHHPFWGIPIFGNTHMPMGLFHKPIVPKHETYFGHKQPVDLMNWRGWRRIHISGNVGATH